MNTPITVTLARNTFDQTTNRVVTPTWEEFCAAMVKHERREIKNVGDGDLGFSVARFKAERCMCMDPPDGDLHKGCPDHALNNPTDVWRGHRTKENVIGISLIGCDLDKSNTRKRQKIRDGYLCIGAGREPVMEFCPLNKAEMHEALGRLRASGFDCVVHSTHSFDGEENCNLRVFILPSKEITPELWARGIFGSVMSKIGIPSGIGQRPDCRRFWFGPSARDGAPVFAEIMKSRS